MDTKIVDALRAALGADVVDTSEAGRSARRHDYWVKSQLDDMEGQGAPSPCAVVRPRSVRDVQVAVRLCRDSRTSVTPFGLGSGVVGGVVTSADTVLLDMGAMNRTRSIDRTNLVGDYDAGCRGSDVETELNAVGLTTGHFPQSIGLSSVGGWVATRAAGQYSTAYGNIEDIVFAIEAVMPNGDIVTTRSTPRASSGPDIRHLLLGSEGTLGVVTGVALSLRRMAPERRLLAFHTADMARGFELQRAIIQSGWQPAVMRQYDHFEVARLFPGEQRGEQALLLMVSEGPEGKAEAEAKGVAVIAEQQGAARTSDAAVEHWLEERNSVPGFEKFLRTGVILDTIEVAAPWDRIVAVYDAAIASLRAVPGIVNASAHSSHCYRSGINLYFTFAAIPPAREQMGDCYADCWRRVLTATRDNGGGVSHHHGIGRVRRDWLEGEIGRAGVDVLRSVKGALDPAGIMNPGVLIPDAQ